eukprot:2743854-Pyramimonas_sp.AAC.1
MRAERGSRARGRAPLLGESLPFLPRPLPAAWAGEPRARGPVSGPLSSEPLLTPPPLPARGGLLG